MPGPQQPSTTTLHPPPPLPSLQTSQPPLPLPTAPMDPAKERRIAETVRFVCANLPSISAALAAAIDRATQEAMIRQDINAGIDIHHSERVADTPPPPPPPPPLPSATSQASLGAPSTASAHAQGFEDLPENFLEADSSSNPANIGLTTLSNHPPTPTTTPILVAQNGLQYVKVELGGSGVAGKPMVVSSASLPSSLIQSVLAAPTPTTSTSGGAETRDGPGSNNGLNSSEEDAEDIYIETRDLCKRIAYELKQHSIPQAVFAEKVLCRSQGTLSDLLRNPKPWNKLKSGRETFRRMYAWLKQPLEQRLETVELWRSQAPPPPPISIPTESRLAKLEAELKREAAEEEEDSDGLRSPPRFAPATDAAKASNAKRPRLVFTDIQKRTLQAIFKETQRPSKEMQQTISEHLGLDLSTVQNFFMNARRRYRINPSADGPSPNQKLRPITPPPASPPPSAANAAPASLGRPPKRRAPTEEAVETVEVVEEEAVAEDFLIHPNGAKTIFQAGSDGLSLDDPGAPTPPAYEAQPLPSVQEVLAQEWSAHTPSSAAVHSPKKRILIGYSTSAAASNPPNPS